MCNIIFDMIYLSVELLLFLQRRNKTIITQFIFFYFSTFNFHLSNIKYLI